MVWAVGASCLVGREDEVRCWDAQTGGGRGEEGEGRADGRGILILAYVFECNTGDHPPSPLKIRVVVSYYLIYNL